MPDQADQLALIEEVRRACVAGDGADPLDEAAALALDHHGLSGAALETAAHGFALLREGELTLAVAPSARGHGLGGRLASSSTSSTSGRARLAWSHGDHPAAAALATGLGWARTRELWVMRRPSSRALPDLELPPGVHIRGFVDADLEAVLAVNASAFAHHPEQGSLDRAGFDERTAEPWWDPAGLLVAVDTDETVLGFHWTKQHDPRLGEVYVVGVGPDAQGRGLGRALTLAGLRHLVGLGVDEVMLYVESDNAAAVHVYGALGFEHADHDTHVQYSAPSIM